MLQLNMEDVVRTLQTCAPYLLAFAVVAVLALIAALACRKCSKATRYLIRAQSGIAVVLALVVVVNLICFGPMATVIDLATGNGSLDEATSEEAIELAERIAEEGIVLLENDGMLPLAGEVKLNVFGWASTNPCYGGAGSGSLNDSYHTVSLLEGLANAGIETNEEISAFYTDYRADDPEVGVFAQDWTLPEPPADQYPEALLNNAQQFSDTAMIVISRPGAEGTDLPTDMTGMNYTDNSDDYTDFQPGDHYLRLTQSERDMIELVASKFENVVLVYNGANTFELGFVREYPQIKSVIWCPSAGQVGFNALGRILTGQVNPSGKTPDTFIYDLTQAPYFHNIGNFAYTNADEFAFTSTDVFSLQTVTTLPHFVNYTEGIYVGYRYYETAAAEGLIDYDETVLYPFGYGLSYTQFTQEMGPLSVEDGAIRFEVTVTNTGDTAGKDVVEVYYNPPYTNGGIEKATANLVAFEKTELLEPGESQTVEISFLAEDMASFDTHGAGAYVLESGDYIISINRDSHTILDSQTYTNEQSITYTDENKRTTDQTAATSLFQYAEGEVVYLSRADGFANYDQAVAGPSSLEMSDTIKEGFVNNANYVPEEHNDPADTMPVTGADNGLTLEDLRGAEYDDPRWESLLDQLTVSDMNRMISLAGFQTAAAPSVGKIQTIDCDGPAAINNNFTRVGSVGFPSAVIVAGTWNKTLAMEFGRCFGKMADEMDVSGWYAPAMNIHRSAFGGRNFEYYSEDGVLSGEIASNVVIGASEYGVYAYLKHFALNEQETNRGDMLCTWATEQSMREIYFKPFELCVKEGGARAVMSAFNYIGNRWAGASSALLNDLLRGEWGFQGFVLTDFFMGGAYMDAEIGIRNGNDACLAPVDFGSNNVHDQTSATSVAAMRQSCKNILYTVVNSRAYEPENVSFGPHTWQIAAIAIDAAVVVLLLALELLVVRKGYQKRKADNAHAGRSDTAR